MRHHPAMPRPPRVLVVDDNRAIRILLTQILELHGCATVEAERAEDALRLATQDPPDLMVVDQFLPGWSGAELIRMVRGSASGALRTIPIVGLSGRAGAADLVEAGATCFLAKPFNEHQLLGAVQAVLPQHVVRRVAS
jgi:CheY-like chemotaxis protein